MSIYYLAYGSNLHPIRLTQRIPSTRLVGPVKLAGYQLHFHKQGKDQSGKCNIVSTQTVTDVVYCALYHIDIEHKNDLDRIEGKGYDSHNLKVKCKDKFYDCFTYIASQEYIAHHLKPFHWYKFLVEHGARYHRFPQEYLSQIQSVSSVSDANIDRTNHHETLLEDISKTLK